ncbi:helix-turn-helix domain-containing protein [Kitasatospora kifunensis]|uniref:DNA-binding CsgD family transcriptional regulator n=1 Tax=Kitasatospora kifunensis TaxID=58351 RepID=A0A7W7VTQ0_KITKI|nr:DNA-binding CsgD family transcriptional regulator [Kitasatospora kifunensis]
MAVEEPGSLPVVVEAMVTLHRAFVSSAPTRWPASDPGGSGVVPAQRAAPGALEPVRARGRQPRPSARPDLLSAREREILWLVDQALSNRQIGSRLNITEGTVKRHLSNIFAKLGAVSRIDAVNKARAVEPSWQG